MRVEIIWPIRLLQAVSFHFAETLALANTNKGMRTYTVYTHMYKGAFLRERAVIAKWRVVIRLLALDNKCRAVLS